MRGKNRLRTMLACVLLQYGVLIGVPVRTVDLEALQRALSGPTAITQNDTGGDPPRE